MLRQRRSARTVDGTTGREPSDDAGVTLIELVVTFTLMTVIGVMAVNFFVQAMSYTSETTDVGLAGADGRAAISDIANLIRLADTPTGQAGYPTARFETVASNKLVFYSNLSARSGSTSRTAPTKVVLFASAGQLSEQLYAPKAAYPTDYTTNYPTTATSTRVLVNTLHSTNVFTYCSDDIDASTGACTTPTSVGAQVASVSVSLTIDGLPGEPSQTFAAKIGITGALAS